MFSSVMSVHADVPLCGHTRQGVVHILRWLNDEEVVDVQYLQVTLQYWTQKPSAA